MSIDNRSVVGKARSRPPRARFAKGFANSGGGKSVGLTPRSVHGPTQALKRSLDVFVASLALICLAPLLLFAAFAIKLDDRGPIIFRQRRVGQSGKRFVIYKFRTMSVAEDGQWVEQARQCDPRVTRVGRLLRQSSIDELPQFLNVLRGDMSIVGPRPHAVAHDEYYRAMISNYALRARVKPGISGWAQVHGLRGGTEAIEEMQARVQMDNWYIDNWSLWLDVKILWKTCVEVASFRAY